MRNKLIVPEVEFVLNQLKTEIAQELGIEIHPDMKSRDAGRIGGTLTKRLIEMGKQSLIEQGINNSAIANDKINQVQAPQNVLH